MVIGGCQVCSPNNNKGKDVSKVFDKKTSSDLFADTWPRQPSQSKNAWIESNDDVKGKQHSKNNVSLFWGIIYLLLFSKLLTRLY